VGTYAVVIRLSNHSCSESAVHLRVNKRCIYRDLDESGSRERERERMPYTGKTVEHAYSSYVIVESCLKSEIPRSVVFGRSLFIDEYRNRDRREEERTLSAVSTANKIHLLSRSILIPIWRRA
jgi:hypothetical protein